MGQRIGWRLYQKLTKWYWKGRKVRLRQDISNSWCILQAGTVLTINGKHNGFQLVSDPCPYCAVRVQVSRVFPNDVEVVEDGEETLCSRWLLHNGGWHRCLRPEGHPLDGHLFELADVDTRVSRRQGLGIAPSSGGADWQFDVLTFCINFGVPYNTRPTVPEENPDAPGMMGTLEKRKAFLDEETLELKKAMEEADLAHVGKEVADVIFVALGIATAYGVSMPPIWNLVQTSNMAKTGGAFRADGKILKPKGWVPPDIQAEIDRQG